MTLILEKKYSQLIYYTSFTLLITNTIGFYNKYYINSLLGVFLFGTSVDKKLK